jgi:hypothetical protein
MKQDCSQLVLEVLTRRCSTTLKKLNVESSKHVDDTCLPLILKCMNLNELGVFKTGKLTQMCSVISYTSHYITKCPRSQNFFIDVPSKPFQPSQMFVGKEKSLS